MTRSSAVRAAFALSWLLAGACGRGPEPRAVGTSPVASASAAEIQPTPPGSDEDLAFHAGLLQRESALTLAAGAEALAALGVEAGGEGDRLGRFVTTPRDGCLLVVGRGTRTIDDLDLLVYDDEGSLIAADEAPDAEPTLVLCGAPGRRLFAAVRVNQGKGVFALGVQSIHTTIAWRIGKALGAKDQGIPGAPPPEPWPGLDAKVAALRAGLGGTWREVGRRALPVDAKVAARTSFAVDDGKCLALLVVPSDDTSELDVELTDGRGAVLGRAEPRPPRDRVTFVCSALHDEVTVAVQPRYAEGVAAIVALTGDEPPPDARRLRLEVYPRGSLADAVNALAARRTAEGYEAPRPSVRLEARVGARVSRPLQVPAGCARVDAVAGAPTAGVHLELWTIDGALLATGDGGGGASVHVCGEAATLRLEIEARLRGGPVQLEVRAEDAPADLDVAGAHALTRLAATGRPSPLRLARRVEIEADHESSTEIPLAAATCVDVAAGADKPSAGVELRVWLGGDELTKSLGVGSAMTRVCVDRATTVRATLRLDPSARRAALLVR